MERFVKSFLVLSLMTFSFVLATSSTSLPTWAASEDEESKCSADLAEGLIGESGAPELTAVRAAIDEKKETRDQLKKDVAEVKELLRVIEEEAADKKDACNCITDGCNNDSDLSSLGIKVPFQTKPEIYNTESYCFDIVRQVLDDEKRNAKNKQSTRYSSLLNERNRYVSTGCYKAARSCAYGKKYVKVLSWLAQAEDDYDRSKKDLECLGTLRAAAVAACPQCALVDAMRPKSTGDYILAGLGVMAPVMGTGIQAWMYNKGLQAQGGFNNQYMASYYQYLQQCASMGIPCSGPMGGMGGAMGGGMGYGYPIGGMGMGGMMPMGGLVGGINIGLLGGGMMPMGGLMMGGMGPFGMGIGGIGMGGPFGMSMGMPMGMGMGIGMAPYGMGIGGIGMGGPFGMSMGMPMGMGMGIGMAPYGMGIGGIGMGGPFGMSMGMPMGMGMGLGIGGGSFSPFGMMGGYSPFVGAIGGGAGIGSIFSGGGYGIGGGVPFGGGYGYGMPGGYGFPSGGGFSPYGGGYGGMPGLMGMGIGGVMGGLMGGAMGGGIGGYPPYMGPPGVGLGYGYPIAGNGGYPGGYPGGGMGPVWSGGFPGMVGPGGWGNTNGGYPGSWAPQTGSPGYYNPTYGMYGNNAQYGAMYGASAQSAILQGMQSQQMGQNVQLAQQQLVEAQMRYQQSMGGYSGYMSGGYYGNTGLNGAGPGRTF